MGFIFPAEGDTLILPADDDNITKKGLDISKNGWFNSP